MQLGGQGGELHCEQLTFDLKDLCMVECETGSGLSITPGLTGLLLPVVMHFAPPPPHT